MPIPLSFRPPYGIMSTRHCVPQLIWMAALDLPYETPDVVEVPGKNAGAGPYEVPLAGQWPHPGCPPGVTATAFERLTSPMVPLNGLSPDGMVPRQTHPVDWYENGKHTKE